MMVLRPGFRGLMPMIGIASITILAAALTLQQLTRPILIGVVLPISTSLGNEENLFIRYFQATRPRIGLRPVRFVIANPAPIEEEVRSAYRRLDGLGVSAVLGGVLSQDGLWLSEEAARTGIPTFGITSSSSLMSGKKDFFFRLCPTTDKQARAVADFYRDNGCRKLAVVTSPDNRAYAEPFVATIAQGFGGEILVIPFVSGADTAERIRESKSDGVFNILPAKDLIRVINAVRTDFPDILLSSSSWGSVEILSLYSGPLLDGMLFFSYTLDVVDGTFRTEIEAFQRRYGMKATNGSAYAVSLLSLLYAAIDEVGPSRAALGEYFGTPRTYETAYGKISMDAYGDGLTDRVLVLQTMNGEMNTKLVLKEP